MFLKMILKYIPVLIVMLLGFIYNAECQVCTRRSVVITTSRERYFYTYREQYQTRCWYGGTCTKTRIRTNSDYRIVPTRQVKTIRVCCDGYLNTGDYETLDCQPICTPWCRNGYCKSPGECACKEGYLEDPTAQHSCEPQCSEGCKNGTCVAPEVCQCDFGYVFNITCQPICSEPCFNGKCTAPDTCECLEGYRKSENNICEPYCSKGCSHGVCSQPEMCTCNDGYLKEDDKCVPVCKGCGNGTCIGPDVCDCDPGYIFENSTCQPICIDSCLNGYCAAPFTCDCNPGYFLQFEVCVPHCSNHCGNGICTAPDTCECAPGYKFTNSCDPTCCEVYCSTPCVNGFCSEPDVCDCNVGYKKDFELDACVPDCPYDCGNSSCTAPNFCECYPGYEKKINDGDGTDFDKSVCQPVCKNCEGNCIEPNTCVCNPEFETKHEDTSGEDCDCFVNCSDTSKQCDRTICILKTTIETTTETELVTISLKERHESYVEDGLMDYDFENFKTFKTETPNILSTEAISPEDYANFFTESIDDYEFMYTSNLHKSNESSITSVWIYVAIGAALMLVSVVVLVLIVKRKVLSHMFSGGSYVVDAKSEESSSRSRSLDMRFSTLERSERDSYG